MGRKNAKSRNPDTNIVVQPPEELRTVWNTEIEEAFRALNARQQKFLLVYFRTGVAAEAYRQSYNPLSSAHLATVCGSEILSNPVMQPFLAKMTETRTADLLLIKQTFRDMTEAVKPQWQQDKDGQWENVGDVPDWKARKDGADGLARLEGMYDRAESHITPPIQGGVVIIELPRKKPLPPYPAKIPVQ